MKPEQRSSTQDLTAIPGCKSVDLHGGRIAADLNECWPFGDGEIGAFQAHDALEHLRDPIHAMKELHRCLAPQGWLLSQTPSTDGRGAFQAPTHVSFWNSNSFWYYTRSEQAKFINSPVLFEANRLKNFFPSEWHREHQIVYLKAGQLKVAGRVPGEGDLKMARLATTVDAVRSIVSASEGVHMLSGRLFDCESPTVTLVEHCGGRCCSAAGGAEVSNFDEAIHIADSASGFYLDARRDARTHQCEIVLGRAFVVVRAVRLLHEAVA